ncbi:hypothetical protein LTR36_003921 [Oleoguttula mirabilis]|uniref:Uncharacterized protein n=1 Tax=Oleoguttula mirabilis TaxID=1507867 RepID=A0AAV9JHL1_9PEZI|nr:hypothetical protein LTR36_003921 [Oleoguttula mirabilis]
MATAEYGSTPFARSPSASLPRSPDTASPLYPERAIRPLPRSRLKSKLSPDQANHIVYPPDPPPMSPTLQFSGPQEQEHGSGNGNGNGDERGLMQHGGSRDAYQPVHPSQHHAAPVHDHHHCTCGEDGGSEDDEAEFDHPDYRYQGYAGAVGTPTPSAPLAGLVNGGSKRVDNIQRRLLELGKAGGLPPPAGSVASSADGYESFENTSNKKKRKIPLSSALSMPTASLPSVHQSQLSAEMASMGISGQTDGAMDDGVNGGPVVGQQQVHATPGQPATPSSGTGISGAGRGRYGRQNGWRNGERKGTVVSLSGGPPYPNRTPTRAGDVKNGGADPNGIDSATGGIISQAIKSAAEQGPLTPPKANGKESPASLLQSASANSTTTPAKTQFTFACESESGPKMEQQVQAQQQAIQAQAAYASPSAHAGYGNATYGAQMPGAYPMPVGTPNSAPLPHTIPSRPSQNGHAPGQALPPGGKGMSTQGTQTTPSLRQGGGPAAGGNGAGRPPPPPSGNPNGPPLPPGQNGGPPGPGAPLPAKPKTRRKPSKEYALAARQRQLQQEYTNYHHRPTKDNMWICEFCEYEDIFGVPPVAMIRSYEIKDRAERKKAAEKRRLLEKAKMKGRKGKKGKGKGGNNNNSGNNAAAAAPAPLPANGGVAHGNPNAMPNGGANYDANQLPPPEGEEYYDDEEEYGDEEYGDEYEPVGSAHGHPPDDGGGYYPPPPVSTPAALTPTAGAGAGGGPLGAASA